jgi:hypothetical protein
MYHRHKLLDLIKNRLITRTRLFPIVYSELLVIKNYAKM